MTICKYNFDVEYSLIAFYCSWTWFCLDNNFHKWISYVYNPLEIPNTLGKSSFQITFNSDLAESRDIFDFARLLKSN